MKCLIMQSVMELRTTRQIYSLQLTTKVQLKKKGSNTLQHHKDLQYRFGEERINISSLFGWRPLLGIGLHRMARYTILSSLHSLTFCYHYNVTVYRVGAVLHCISIFSHYPITFFPKEVVCINIYVTVNVSNCVAVIY